MGSRTRRSEATLLVSAVGHPEGPVVLDDGRVVYCQAYDGTLGVWSAGEGVGTYARTGGCPNGAVLGLNDCLYVANNGGALGVFRTEDFGPGFIQKVHPDGSTEVVAREVGGRQLNLPNDLVFGPDGRLYFTDPGAWSPEDEDRKQDGFIMALNPDGTGEVLVDVGKVFPNGIQVEQDGSVVWVETYTRKVRRRRADGSIEEILRWEDPRFAPDGLTVEANGDLVIATLNSGGFHIVSPDGSEQTLVDLGGTTLSNITFGPGGTLYATDLGTKPAATNDKVYFGSVLRIDSELAGMPAFRGEIRSLPQ